MQPSINYEVTSNEVGKTLEIFYRPPGEMISEHEANIKIKSNHVGVFIYELLGTMFNAQLQSIKQEIDRKAFIENTNILDLIGATKKEYDEESRERMLKSFTFRIR